MHLRGVWRDHHSNNLFAHCGINIGSPSHFRGARPNTTLRREAPRGWMTPRLPVNDWRNVLLASSCATSRASQKVRFEADA